MRRTRTGFSLVEALLILGIVSIVAIQGFLTWTILQSRDAAHALIGEFETALATLRRGDQPVWPDIGLPATWAVTQDKGVPTLTVTLDLTEREGDTRTVCNYAALLVSQRQGMTLNGAIASPFITRFRGPPSSPLCKDDRAVIAMAIRPPSECPTASEAACPTEAPAKDALPAR